tara:strand:+ start:77 stop:562 length:486 start_codon:yes stop_codon:yes gene_type:complete
MNQSNSYYNIRWFILRVKARHENKVAELLERQDFNVYNPTIKVKRKWSDRIKTINLPAIPGIIFIQTSLLEKNKVFCSTSIKGWFYENKVPVTVKDDELEIMKKSLADKVWISKDKEIKVGDLMFLENIGVDAIIRKLGMNFIWVYVKNTNITLKLDRMAA